MTEQAPSNPYQAAAWLRRRHPWLDELVTRVDGPPGDPDNGYGWVQVIVAGFNDMAETGERWEVYESNSPPPRDDDAFYAWQDAGPQYATYAAKAMAPMSSGELRVLRLMTTLSRENSARCRTGWIVDDVDFDHRGAAIVEDWIAVVRAQLTALQH